MAFKQIENTKTRVLRKFINPEPEGIFSINSEKRITLTLNYAAMNLVDPANSAVQLFWDEGLQLMGLWFWRLKGRGMFAVAKAQKCTMEHRVGVISCHSFFIQVGISEKVIETIDKSPTGSLPHLIRRPRQEEDGFAEKDFFVIDLSGNVRAK